MIYRDDPYRENWDSSSWYTEISRNVTSPIIKTDPYDSRVEVRGTGTVAFEGGEATFYKSPYLYIEASAGGSDRSGWNDVEFTAYGKFALDANPKANAGINIQLRSDHGLVSTGDGCDAQFYWAQITREGEASLVKELYHDDEVVVRSKKISLDIDEFSSGLPIDEWIGVKFIAFNTGGVNVRLELYLDTSGKNNDWKRVATYKDRPGQWNTTKPVPSTCSHTAGDTILGPSRYCALFNVGHDESTQGKLIYDLSVIQSSFSKAFTSCRVSTDLSSFFINQIHPTVTWKDVSVRSIIPEPLAEICEQPSSSPSTDLSRAPTLAPQTTAPTLAPQSKVPTMAPQTSNPSAKPSSTPSIVPSQVPSQYPTRSSIIASPLPSEIPSLVPPSSASPSIKPSLIATAQIIFPGIDEQMTESELELFEETTTVWFQGFANTSLIILSVEVRGQELVFSTIPDDSTRKLRRSQEVQGTTTTALAVTISVAALASVEEGDESPTLSAFVDDVISSESKALRDELSHAVPLFAIEEPPLDGRGGDGDAKDQEKNVGAIVGSVLVSMLFAITVVASVFYRLNRCTKMPLQVQECASCSSSSIGSASLFTSVDNHQAKDQTTMDSNLDADSDRVFPMQQLASRESGNPLSDDAESIESTSDFSYAMSSVGVSTDAGDFGAGLIKGSSTTTNQEQDLEEDLIPPSSIAHHLYPIISVSESGESANEATGGERLGDSGPPPNDDGSLDSRMHHQKKSIEMLLNDDEDNDDGSSLGTDDGSEGVEDGPEDVDASTDLAKKGSPIKTMFSCFQPEPPVDRVRSSTLASSSMMSVGSASSKSLAAHSSPSRRPTEQYEIRAPPGSLGMVVVTSREGPRVYHVKDESPLANVIEEGDIILSIDNHNTQRMTATSLRRFLRSRDAQDERVITIKGRKRNADEDSSSGEHSL